MSRIGVVSWLGLLFAGVLYVAANTLFNSLVATVRLDLTEDGLYTLSPGTRATLANIDEPLSLTLFFSERLGREIPQYAAYGRRVRDLLGELTAAADGKIILHEVQPEPFSEQEDWAVSYGLQGVPVDEDGELSYFGLVGINSVDETELIAFFQAEREALLEYDIAQLIDTLATPEPAVIGVLSSLPILGDMQERLRGGVMVPWAIGKRLRQNFQLLNLPPTIERFPETIDVMLIAHPRTMTARAVYELEQFLFRGGKALLLIDPRAEADRTAGPDQVSSSATALEPLFEHWGIRIPTDRLVGDRSLALRVNAGSAAAPMPAEYLAWLGITGEYLAQHDPVSSQLPILNLASAGYIERDSHSPLTVQPLISSSENSATVDARATLGSRPNVLGLLERFESDDNTYVLAARLSGEVTTAFADGPPLRASANNTQALNVQALDSESSHKLRSEGSIHLLLVADVDLLDERFWLRKQQFFGREVEQQIAGNADFVINALENLSGGDELLELRSRGVSQRPFERVDELRQRAQRRTQGKERELQAQLEKTQQRIAELQGDGVQAATDATSGDVTVSVSLSDEQRAGIEALRQQMLTTRKQLRATRLGLREDVEHLQTWLQFINIGLAPLLVSAFALLFATMRLTRRRRRPAGDKPM